MSKVALFVILSKDWLIIGCDRHGAPLYFVCLSLIEITLSSPSAKVGLFVVLHKWWSSWSVISSISHSLYKGAETPTWPISLVNRNRVHKYDIHCFQNNTIYNVMQNVYTTMFFWNISQSFNAVMLRTMLRKADYGKAFLWNYVVPNIWYSAKPQEIF